MDGRAPQEWGRREWLKLGAVGLGAAALTTGCRSEAAEGASAASGVATAALADSGLLSPGTLFSTRYRLDLPQGTDPAKVRTAAEVALKGSGMRWRDAGIEPVSKRLDRVKKNEGLVKGVEQCVARRCVGIQSFGRA